jgi:hypothetical protein
MRGTVARLLIGAASHLACGLREPCGEVPRRVPHATFGMRNVHGWVVNFLSGEDGMADLVEETVLGTFGRG